MNTVAEYALALRQVEALERIATAFERLAAIEAQRREDEIAALERREIAPR